VNSRAFGRDTGPDRFRLALWTEGFEETVARHLHDTDILGAQHGVASEVLENEAHVRLWEKVRDFPLAASRWTARVTVPRRSWATVVSTIVQWEAADFSPAIVSDAACSVLWIAAVSDNPIAEHFLKINSLARAHDGHAILVSAPAELKFDIDVWGGSPPALALMREIKRQLDPRGLLNPGRFVGGI
jgi:glycolate oxidase FAD binding subunit